MPSNKKPRKKYRPREIRAMPIDYVLSGFSRLGADASRRLRTVMHTAYDAMLSGKANKVDWQGMTDSLNVALAMSRLYYDGQYADVITKAQQGHAAAGNRYLRGMPFSYNLAEMAAVREAMLIHEIQLDQATVENIENAWKEVKRSLDRGNFITVEKYKDGHENITTGSPAEPGREDQPANERHITLEAGSDGAGG